MQILSNLEKTRSFRASSHIEIFFEGLRALIDLLSDIIINPNVGITSFLREEFRVKDSRMRDVLL